MVNRQTPSEPQRLASAIEVLEHRVRAIISTLEGEAIQCLNLQADLRQTTDPSDQAKKLDEARKKRDEAEKRLSAARRKLSSSRPKDLEPGQLRIETLELESERDLANGTYQLVESEFNLFFDRNLTTSVLIRDQKENLNQIKELVQSYLAIMTDLVKEYQNLRDRVKAFSDKVEAGVAGILSTIKEATEDEPTVQSDLTDEDPNVSAARRILDGLTPHDLADSGIGYHTLFRLKKQGFSLGRLVEIYRCGGVRQLKKELPNLHRATYDKITQFIQANNLLDGKTYNMLVLENLTKQHLKKILSNGKR